MSISVQLTEEEQRLADYYTKEHDISLEEAFKRAFFEMIEDELDIAEAKRAYAEYVASGKQSRPISELWEELGL